MLHVAAPDNTSQSVTAHDFITGLSRIIDLLDESIVSAGRSHSTLIHGTAVADIQHGDMVSNTHGETNPNAATDSLVARIRLSLAHAKWLREAVVNFYQRNCSQKLTERDFVDSTCSGYEGREIELDAALRLKYGTGLFPPG